MNDEINNLEKELLQDYIDSVNNSLKIEMDKIWYGDDIIIRREKIKKCYQTK